MNEIFEEFFHTIVTLLSTLPWVNAINNAILYEKKLLVKRPHFKI